MNAWLTIWIPAAALLFYGLVVRPALPPIEGLLIGAACAIPLAALGYGIGLLAKYVGEYLRKVIARVP